MLEGRVLARGRPVCVQGRGNATSCSREEVRTLEVSLDFGIVECLESRSWFPILRSASSICSGIEHSSRCCPWPRLQDFVAAGGKSGGYASNIHTFSESGEMVLCVLMHASFELRDQLDKRYGIVLWSQSLALWQSMLSCRKGTNFSIANPSALHPVRPCRPSSTEEQSTIFQCPQK